ncbi:DNA-methyltransferase [Candidatus Palauibacter sp.]|uniref:DNA-methyltransferase n=1 Tax=Candidatus Palauibacter sp. TaxID=3101350 RepID=UPI003CC61ACE
MAREILEDGLMFAADAREFLSSVHDGTADLVFLDPPFNLGKRYGKSPAREDRLTDAEYCDFLEDVIRNSVRVLREGGSLFVYHLPVWALRIGAILEGELEFCHWIAVSMKGSFPLDGRLYPAHYALLYYSKGTPRVFHRPKIPPAKCRHCDKIVKDYGGYVKHIREGLNLSDVWDDLSPVRRRRNKRRAGNELPLELLRRVMAIGGERGRLLVDPFAGAGTSLVAAREIGMEFIACDREEERCDVIRKRLATVGEGDGELSGEEVSAVDETDPEVLRGYGFRDGEEGSDGESVGL